ncbi:hypothetical protein OH76DRAFT_1489903 [Lentinus brumalis]|uniref:Uncharacterized protein n=1 Tax=Lentinus brumalis TaxID=2498619 RepID=A0A371CKX3_9APHY|nr:hypothetical protein OH76DRAFT_1489903 [Polyporus brumalis]
MNYNQLREAMDRKNDEKNALKLKVLMDARKYNTVTARLTDHEHFMNAIIDSDYESVGRLVNIAIRNNKSVRDIVCRLELAIAGKYQVQSYELLQ